MLIHASFQGGETLGEGQWSLWDSDWVQVAAEVVEEKEEFGQCGSCCDRVLVLRSAQSSSQDGGRWLARLQMRGG